MAKTKTTPKPQSKRKPADPDARIVAAAVKFAQCMAGFAAGFTADPDGDFKYAGPERGSPLWREAVAALAFLGEHPARSPEGLSAKARIAPTIVKDDTGLFENGGASFLSSFAADVKEFAEPMVYANWSAALELRKRGSTAAIDNTGKVAAAPL